MMEKILDLFNEGWFSTVVGVLAGTLVTYVGIIATRKRKILVYSIESRVILQNFETKINDLEIKYRDKPIKNLTSTRIAIWNNGRETIKKEDIPPKEPISILFSEDLVGEPEISFIKNASNEIRLERKGNKLIFDFLFLEHLDGAVVQAFHGSELSHEDFSKDNNDKSKAFSFSFLKLFFGIDLDEEYPERDEYENIGNVFISGKVIGHKKISHSHNRGESTLDEYSLLFQMLLVPLVIIALGKLYSLVFGGKIPFLLFSIIMFLCLFSVLSINARHRSARKRSNPRVTDML